ncbi:MAG: radical SAM protein [Bacteroidota bacterium]|nr:radical SAM protein [Bacteroidota bacterium]
MNWRMEVISKVDGNDIARVYIARNRDGKLVEFVESTQPPLSIRQKWVLIISTLFGCPVDCKFCDAGGSYQGKLSKEELFFQIDYAVRQRFPEGSIDTDKFKVQFARMGEPVFNKEVIDVLKEIPSRYHYRSFVPSLSTIGPSGSRDFFDELLALKKELYPKEFQLQFSIHSTEKKQRDELLPVKKMDFTEIAAYGEKFFDREGKKITLNFALGKNSIVNSSVLRNYFSPDIFLIKLTPVNPTLKASYNGIESLISLKNHKLALLDELNAAGFEHILSIGEWEENKIGSNCGQYVNSVLQECRKSEESYTYRVETI